MNFSITPENFLREIGCAFQKRGRWLTWRICPFCNGGSSGDTYSFSVHAEDGNYFCHRAKCSEKGSFWKLIESQGRNPREYLGERESKQRKKRFVYGKINTDRREAGQADKCFFSACQNQVENKGDVCQRCSKEFWLLICEKTKCKRDCPDCKDKFHHYFVETDENFELLTHCKHCRLELPFDISETFEKVK